MNQISCTRAAFFAALLGFVVTVTAASPSLAQQSPGPPKKLEIGMPAPPLMIDTWVKGEPVEKLKKGHPYVIEFWATWCGPCRQTIPHLTELQKKYGDKLTIIGISSEPKGLPEVKPFVEKMGAKMDYRVAFDKGGGTNNAWMVAAGQQGIPCSFVVDQQGQIAFIGHPGELAGILDEVVDGSWDINVYKIRKERIKEVEAKLQAAAQAQDAAKMVEGLDELMVVDPARSDAAAVKKFELLLFALHNYVDGYKWAAQLVDVMFRERPDMLNAIAWAIVDGKGIEKRDLDLALRAAIRAEDLTNGTNMEVLDTLARVHFEKGNIGQAVTTQEQALKLAVDPKRKGESQARLDKYKAAQG